MTPQVGVIEGRTLAAGLIPAPHETHHKVAVRLKTLLLLEAKIGDVVVSRMTQTKHLKGEGRTSAPISGQRRKKRLVATSSRPTAAMWNCLLKVSSS